MSLPIMDYLKRSFALWLILLNSSNPSQVWGEDVLTQRNNNSRIGQNFSPELDQNTVKTFQLLQSLAVDAPILAQPLLVQNQEFKAEQHSVLWIATARNTIYAFNAEAPFQSLCSFSLGEPDVPDPNFVGGAQLVFIGQTGIIGIESTPTIDRTNNTMFVSYRRKAPGVGQQRLAAVDIRTCSVRSDVAVPGGPNWQRLHRNRASLLLEKGVVFVAFAGILEYNGGKPKGSGYEKSWQGWVHAFDANTLAPLGSYRTMHDPANNTGDTSNDRPEGGGIWQASTGLAADANGDIYFATGNASGNNLPPDADNLASSVVRLSVTRVANPDRVIMTPTDWFTPYSKLWQDGQDIDLGSAGVMLIPGTNYLALAGKEGILYVLDRNNMGKFDNRPTVVCPELASGSGGSRAVPDDTGRDHVTQKVVVGTNRYFAAETPARPLGTCGDVWMNWPHVHGTPTFGTLGNGNTFLYVWPEKDFLQSYRWLGNKLAPNPMIGTNLFGKRVLAPPVKNQSREDFQYGRGVGMPGAMLSLTVDQTKPDAGVLFASVKTCYDSGPTWVECSTQLCGTIDKLACYHQDRGNLRAFDPITLKELWNDQVSTSLGLQNNYNFAKFVPPTIVAGKVYLATASNKVLVYGNKPGPQSEWRFCQKCNTLYFDGYPSKGRCPTGGSHQAAGINFSLGHDVVLDSVAADKQQGDWRFCGKCNSLFFNGYPAKGICPAGGVHQALGYTFVVPHDTATPGQSNWRFCHKCESMFFDGYPTKGRCPAGGAHEAAGFNFVLPQIAAGSQADWRFCTKCKGLFFDGYPDKGKCPAGGGHAAAGFVFDLPHDGSNTGQADWRFCHKCNGMFFDGYPTKGRCPAGGAHESVGYIFILPHDTNGPGQAAWRFCQKCSIMFFDGYPDKGRCPAGGAHQAVGYVFLLNHH